MQHLFGEENGFVVLEAESVPSTARWVETTAFAGYTGSSAIEWTGSNNFGTPGRGVREYTVQINSPGTFHFQWRSRIGKGNSNTEHNHAWLKLPDTNAILFGQRGSSKIYPRGTRLTPNPNGSSSDGWFKIHMNQLNTWSWQTKTSDNDAHDIYIEFTSAGVYTIQVSGRSNGYVIDRMVLSPSTGSYSASQLTGLS